ncbi:MAG TPA: MarC family protein [Bacteroidetes bacterium]|nr:NAAT family transporter [Ignavibacteria bacterium]HCA41766.1 MarC family protein [Bacteroidota bacterium]HCN38406.1 MarC family protein [Bacteroidota bacterium]
MEELTYYLKVFISVFVLVNPLEGIPLFLSSTASMDAAQKSKIAKQAAIGVITILLFTLFLGKLVLQLFAITIPAFTLAGGIIIFLIAIKMVLGNDEDNPNSPTPVKKDIAIVPLATPLLAGPGPISSVILYATQSTTILDWIMLTIVIFIIGIAVYFSLRGAAKMQVYLKDNGVSVMTRISGILVAAIAVEMIVSGLIQMINLYK